MKISHIPYPIFNIKYLIFFVLFFVLCSLLFVEVKEARAGACFEQGKPPPDGSCENVNLGADCKLGWWVSDKSCTDVVLQILEEKDASSGSQTSVTTKGLKGASGRLGKIGSEIGTTKSLEETIGGFIKGALVLVGTIFLILMVYGGYIWMIARGDEQEAERAKKIIEAAVIGLAIVLAAYAVTFFVVYRLTQATGTLPIE